MECIPAVLCEYLSCRYGEFGAKRQYIEIDMGEKARYFHWFRDRRVELEISAKQAILEKLDFFG